MEKDMKLSREDLTAVNGGDGYVIWKDDGDYEYWFVCSACLKYKELIHSGNRYTDPAYTIEGTFECPRCKWTRQFKVKFGS